MFRQFSHSRVGLFNQCPYRYKLRYLDKLETVKNQDPDNALYLGIAVHEGLEKGLSKAIKSYKSNYYLLNDLNINEIMKLEFLIPLVKEALPKGIYERKIEDDDFIGFMDLLAPIDESGEYADYDTGTYDLFDFKYSNNIDYYKSSEQLHLYKYHTEKKYRIKIRNLYYVMIPKVQIRQKKTEDLFQFRKRLKNELEETFQNFKVVKVEYDPHKVIKFWTDVKRLQEVESTLSENSKNPSYLCRWCEYQDFCEKGEDYMLIPKNERRERVIDERPDFWIYADSYVGKSTFVDKLDDLLFINTDGNTDNTTSPVISIKDDVEVTGRITKRTLAWDKFLDVVLELEKKENDFNRIAIDLVEDLYEHCRLYVYDKLNIEHEQDAGFGKGWDMVRTEFLSTMKRLKNIGYQIIYISKEIQTEINLKGGGSITTFKPNINDRVANVLAGTVDLTFRAYLDGDERYLQLEKKENVFGGGRFDFKINRIPLEMDKFLEELRNAQKGITIKKDDDVKPEVKPETEETKEDPEEEKPKTRRRTKKEEPEKVEEPEEVETVEDTEEPKKRTRRTRS